MQYIVTLKENVYYLTTALSTATISVAGGTTVYTNLDDVFSATETVNYEGEEYTQDQLVTALAAETAVVSSSRWVSQFHFTDTLLSATQNAMLEYFGALEVETFKDQSALIVQGQLDLAAFASGAEGFTPSVEYDTAYGFKVPLHVLYALRKSAAQVVALGNKVDLASDNLSGFLQIMSTIGLLGTTPEAVGSEMTRIISNIGPDGTQH